MRILGQYINYKVPMNSHYLFIFVSCFFLDDALRDAILLCFVKGSLWRGYRTRCYGLQKVNIFSSLWARLLVTSWANIQTELRVAFLRSESCHNRTVFEWCQITTVFLHLALFTYSVHCYYFVCAATTETTSALELVQSILAAIKGFASVIMIKVTAFVIDIILNIINIVVILIMMVNNDIEPF